MNKSVLFLCIVLSYRLNDNHCYFDLIYPFLKHHLQCAYINCVYCLPGLISPGVSVPIQVPGGGPPDMSAHHMGAMASQYWRGLQ